MYADTHAVRIDKTKWFTIKKVDASTSHVRSVRQKWPEHMLGKNNEIYNAYNVKDTLVKKGISDAATRRGEKA